MPLDTQQDIREMDRDGVPRSEIARQLHVSRNTVAKYADMQDLSPRAPIPAERERPVMTEGVAAWIDSVLEADLGATSTRLRRHRGNRPLGPHPAPGSCPFTPHAPTPVLAARFFGTCRDGLARPEHWVDDVWYLLQIDDGIAHTKRAGDTSLPPTTSGRRVVPHARRPCGCKHSVRR